MRDCVTHASFARDDGRDWVTHASCAGEVWRGRARVRGVEVVRDGVTQAAGEEMRRGEACLWFTRLPLHELFEEVRALHFARLASARGARIEFASGARLVELDVGDAEARLTLHPVLNRAETPAEVFGALFKRALWRAQERAPERGAPEGPAFFALCPEGPFAEAWLEHHLGACLVARDGEVAVHSKWREQWLAPQRGEPRLALARALAEAELARLLRPVG